MSQHEKAQLFACLSSGQGETLRNVKFFRGAKDLISETEFREQICASETRKRDGKLERREEPPRCKKGPLDLRALVANI